MVNSQGGKQYIILEGRWENIWDCFLELPKDSVVLHVDDDDFLKATDTRMKKFEDIKDDIKRVIDTCAPSGGFIFTTDKAMVTPGDVNPTLIECFNFAHEYSKK